MTRNQIATAPWHDGPALLIAELDGIWQGIGTRDEFDALKADGIFAAAVTYRPVVPSDLA